ncbi:hypothetical protein AKJ59_00505 [candidate division MSBL1 archaeon SCGC-AAA385M02]|uniref:Uncharacterized protein n=1 Tax=candidate division MSBL1 archaeon SCGC-AAA385M02 TaxID=1698287 RepID=A0A133VQR2_9EURY|nr:hypothetical protein AKJ59_00505 [candidate division MSBL1 archaeon SCGC-AAA385M02]
MITMVKIKCKWCGREWDTKSKLIWVTCPSCGGKTPHPERYEGKEDVDYSLVREDVSNEKPHGSKYDPIIDDFLEMKVDRVKAEIKGHTPHYTQMVLHKRIKARKLLDTVDASVEKGVCYLERSE